MSLVDLYYPKKHPQFMVKIAKQHQQTIRRSLEKLRDSVLADIDRVAFTEDKIIIKNLRVSNEIEAINHAG